MEKLKVELKSHRAANRELLSQISNVGLPFFGPLGSREIFFGFEKVIYFWS